MQKLRKLRTNYAQITQIMQKLLTNYAEITQKLRSNYAHYAEIHQQVAHCVMMRNEKGICVICVMIFSGIA